jgi:crossover junction endodeoxyribonuclease RuvC
MAIEQPYVPRIGLGEAEDRTSVRSAIAVGQAQAVALMAAAARGIPAFAYPPSRVKHSLVEQGWSPKEQVQEMVRVVLGLEERPEPADAADALAVALCHLQEQRVAALLAAAESGGEPTT